MRILATMAGAMLSMMACIAHAGPFAVSPLGAALGPKVKSASFTVTNTGSAPLTFQVAVRRWTQDAQGRDVYEDSKDLVVFPKQLEVPAAGKRIVRVGYEGAAPTAETAYRVFIEELPPAANPGQGRKGSVAVVGRFGLPVFVRPDGAKANLSIDNASASGGKFTAKLSNKGNSAVRIETLDAGTPATAAQVSNPYLLAGASREFSGPLGSACKAGAKVKLTATASGGAKTAKELTLPPNACNV